MQCNRFVVAFACAVAGLLAAAPDARAQSCGDTLSTDTTLTADVVCTAGFTGTALTIVGDVNLDGNGFAIDAVNGTVIEVSEGSSAQLREFGGFGVDGIVAIGASVSLENVVLIGTFTPGGTGLALDATDLATVDISEISGFSTGIHAHSGSDNLVVQNSRLNDNGTGILVENSLAPQLLFNQIVGGATGVALFGSADAVLTSTDVRFAGDGILVDGSDNFAIDGAQLFSPGSPGFGLQVVGVTTGFASVRARGFGTGIAVDDNSSEVAFEGLICGETGGTGADLDGTNNAVTMGLSNLDVGVHVLINSVGASVDITVGSIGIEPVIDDGMGTTIVGIGSIADSDADGVDDACDNCIGASNADQTDGDGDGVGDACADFDGDGVLDPDDNCFDVPNPGQGDSDSDGVGDACDPCEGLSVDDSDFDGFCDDIDNCVFVPNADQTDSDSDGIGDACAGKDGDFDSDGVPDEEDNCPTVPNADQADSNSNGIGDACESAPGDTDSDGVPDEADNCPLVPNPGQQDSNENGVGDACEGDVDGDGVPDAPDNCPFDPNPDQQDSDNDMVGDACDPTNNRDLDDDGIENEQDNCPFSPNADQRDEDGDGVGDACDPQQLFDDGCSAANGPAGSWLAVLLALLALCLTTTRRRRTSRARTRARRPALDP